MHRQYLHQVAELLNWIEQTQGTAIQQAAEIVAQAVAGGGLVYTFGSGHSQLVARDAAFRAGGLVSLVHLPDPAWGLFERIEGTGLALLSQYPVRSGEAIFVISNSGRNPEPIEVALAARQKDLKVIAILSMQHATSVGSRHSSGKKLDELADVALDTGAPSGDAVLSFPGLEERVGPVSTILGATLLHAVIVEAIQNLITHGITPPILISINLEGAIEHNLSLLARFPDIAWVPKYSL